MAFTTKAYAGLVTDMVAYFVANQDVISDLNEGSAIRSMLEAMALEIEDVYIKARVGFDRGMVSLPYDAFDFTRLAGAKAAGNVVFSRTGTSGTVAIALGTLVGTADGLQFATTAAGSILDTATDSASIPILAEEQGIEYNVPAATVTTIITPIAGVETVTNALPMSGGANDETDAAYSQRFQDHIEGLGKSNKAGLITAAVAVTGVRSASVAEHFPPSASYHATVYIDDGTGTASAGLITTVQDKLLGDGTDSDPGFVAAGVNLRVLAPTAVTVTFTMTITDDNTLAQATTTFNVEEAVTTYVNGLGIGEDCIRNRILEAIMGVSGVDDVTLSAPASNTAISSTQIARVGTITVSYV